MIPLIIYGMHRIFRKRNHKVIELLTPNDAGEVIGVLVREGTYKYFRWCGFMERSEAKLTGGKSVKLSVSRIDDYHLQPGEHVHGCLTDKGAYAIIDSTVAILNPDNE